jgi:hypothetical protein
LLLRVASHRSKGTGRESSGWSSVRTAVLVLFLASVVPSGAAFAEEPGRVGGYSLGRVHLSVKYDRIYFDHDVKRFWGIDEGDYLGLDLYVRVQPDTYVGVEIGRSEATNVTDAGGDFFSSVDFYSFEANVKQAIALTRGLSLDIGAGVGIIWIDGKEVFIGIEGPSSTKLADAGEAWQVFVNANWRTRFVFIGLNTKYQFAYDVWGVDYNNFRFGGHAGFVF